jgi:steroid delta-isomerase-like uncharacterized protein
MERFLSTLMLVLLVLLLPQASERVFAEEDLTLEEEDNVEVHQLFIQGVNEHEPDEIKFLYSKRFSAEENGERLPGRGARADLEPLRELWEAFPDYRITVKQVIASGDYVVYRWLATGTQAEDYQEISATEKTISLSGCSIYELKRGKFNRAWHFYDNLAFLGQLGLLEPED